MSALRAVFVYTGAWVALRYGRDQHHGRARTLLRQLRADGAVTLLKARGAVEHALSLGEAIQAGRLGHVIESTAERRRRAWDLFVRYRDRRVGWAFTRAGFTAYR